MATVTAAIRAYVMWATKLVALRAGNELHRLECQMATTARCAPLGKFAFR